MQCLHIDAETYKHVNTYDLVSMYGKSGSQGASGPCRNKSVLDDVVLVWNDPTSTSDLFDKTPDGKHFLVAFRGPVPIAVGHAAQCSSTGVGIVEITENGKTRRHVDVIRTTNIVDNVSSRPGRMTGGHDYIGREE